MDGIADPGDPLAPIPVPRQQSTIRRRRSVTLRLPIDLALRTPGPRAVDAADQDDPTTGRSARARRPRWLAPRPDARRRTANRPSEPPHRVPAPVQRLGGSRPREG